MQTIANYIDGELVEPVSGEYLDNIDPAIGQPYSLISNSDAGDVSRAIESAQRAFPAWSATPTSERSQHLLAIADGIEQKLEDFALAECIDTGKPISLARSVDIPRAISNLRFFATAILHTHSEAHITDSAVSGSPAGSALNYTLRQPRGVAGCISPWNLPLYLLTWKIAPALATGNPVVGKPSEMTPMTAFMLSQVCIDVGLPKGVLNIVHGLGAKVGAAIVAHPGVPAISFTGGTATGAEIARTAGPMFKKLSLELGGKNPNIIFADADLDEAVRTSVRSSFANQGQICLCGSRMFVERSAYDTFIEQLVTQTNALKQGDPLEPDTRQGALISNSHLHKVRSYVELAREEGGEVLTGGGPPEALPARCKDGYFHQPTIITGLNAVCRTNQEEIFGPVVTVMPFDSEEEVAAMANSTIYGLSATVWTSDLARAHRVAAQLQSGTVWINCWLLRDLRVPFGGMKQSGVGREGGDEALHFFTEPKNVCVRL